MLIIIIMTYVRFVIVLELKVVSIRSISSRAVLFRLESSHSIPSSPSRSVILYIIDPYHTIFPMLYSTVHYEWSPSGISYIQVNSKLITFLPKSEFIILMKHSSLKLNYDSTKTCYLQLQF